MAVRRLKDGSRLDLVGQGVEPHDEPADVPTGLPPTSHVRKAGPRGVHDGHRHLPARLPFTEVVEGHVQVGLHFASFQANPAQFETVFRDWLLSPRFPDLGDQQAHGSDALLAEPIVHKQQAGMFFVPPYVEGGLAPRGLRQLRSASPSTAAW